MNFTPEQLTFCGKLALIPYYPKENHADVIEELMAFVDRADGLEWLIKTAVRAMRAWAGISELRGLYCTRFKPADGIEADCSLPGHTPAAIESENRVALAAAEHKLLAAAPEASNAPTGLLAPRAAKAKSLARQEDYKPPAWLRNL